MKPLPRLGLVILAFLVALGIVLISQRSRFFPPAQHLACPPDGNRNFCVCREPIPPTEAHATFEGTLASVRHELGKPSAPEHAEWGKCGETRYVFSDFGETRGYVARYFSPEGRLVATERGSDFGEFCQPRTPALRLYQGEIPATGTLCKTEETLRSAPGRALPLWSRDLASYQNP